MQYQIEQKLISNKNGQKEKSIKVKRFQDLKIVTYLGKTSPNLRSCHVEEAATKVW